MYVFLSLYTFVFHRISIDGKITMYISPMIISQGQIRTSLLTKKPRYQKFYLNLDNRKSVLKNVPNFRFFAISQKIDVLKRLYCVIWWRRWSWRESVKQNSFEVLSVEKNQKIKIFRPLVHKNHQTWDKIIHFKISPK